MKTLTHHLRLTILLVFITVHTKASFNCNATGTTRTGTTVAQKSFLELNGTDAYAEAPQLLSGLGQATIMGWIKLSPDMTVDGFIMGQDNFNLKIVVNGSDKTLIATAKDQSISFSENMVPNRWYHVAAVYDHTGQNKLTLYVNGKSESVSTASVLSIPLFTSTAKFTMGKNPISSSEYLKGALDEIRVFNTALPQDMLQKMVYQEIVQNGTKICGQTIPRDIEGANWDTLLAYYRLDTSNANTTPNGAANGAAPANIYNATFGLQQAPMPFATSQAGLLDVAVSQNNSVNGTDANSNWAIIHISHDISVPSNQIMLGLLIDEHATVTLNNDNKLQNTWYLKLDGKLELRGKSQLIQTADSALDPTSMGHIERIQQGQSNRYNYNYWSAPVSTINPTTNNHGFQIDNILRDGSNAQNLLPINWTSNLDGEMTTPLTLSSFWIFKFQNMTPNYANWSAVGPYGNLLPAQGFTLKGSSPASGVQHLAFVGKPNNGTITTPVAAGNLNLTGNPYPSALDVNAFIAANSSVINGTLYFWEHFASNDTHVLVDYQGGYATRNLVGGTPTFSSNNSDDEAEHKTPGRFIPVGQGFFVKGAWGGEVTFTNSQRVFMKETAADSNTIFRLDDGPGPAQIYDNSNDAVPEDNFARIRLGFDSPNDFHRQVLIGFMNEHATSGVDIGYDSVNIDTQPYDMFLTNNGKNLVIMGEGYFNENNVYPISVKAAAQGTIRFVVDATENLDENQDIFIYDNVTQTHHSIKNSSYEVTVAAGLTTDRFSMRFVNPDALSNNDFQSSDAIGLAFTTANNTIILENSKPDTTVETLVLYDMLGRTIASWNIANRNQTKLQIPIVNASAGTYVIKVHTTSGDISKKIIVQ